MEIFRKTFKTETEVADYLSDARATLFLGNRTSTVLPYEKMESFLPVSGELTLGDLSHLPKKCHLEESGVLTIEGPVTWKEASDFCHSKGRMVMTSPTEELACVLSGLATSCTGERSFGFGTLRDQVLTLEFIDYTGKKKTLNADNSLSDSEYLDDLDPRILKEYQESYLPYSKFKNAPFPRLEKETDLMVGTEGQLGVITKAQFKTAPLKALTFFFISLPKWEIDDTAHREVFEKAQSFREDIISCELIDENSWRYIDQPPVEGRDTIFLEVYQESVDKVYENLLMGLESVDEEQIFEMSSHKFNSLRMAIPRNVAETNSRLGVVKKGTDIQVPGELFFELMSKYREFSHLGIKYNLFGHFGDAHLHFNFMPKDEEVKVCQSELEALYTWVKEKSGSPFAEHGVGLIKKNIMKRFYGETQKKVFSHLKKKLDPRGVFFPYGYMGEV